MHTWYIHTYITYYYMHQKCTIYILRITYILDGPDNYQKAKPCLLPRQCILYYTIPGTILYYTIFCLMFNNLVT